MSVRYEKKSPAEATLRDLNFKGPYVLEDSYTIVKTLSAHTTGDIFILTPERRVIYRGPLDDQYHLLKSAIKSQKPLCYRCVGCCAFREKQLCQRRYRLLVV